MPSSLVYDDERMIAQSIITTLAPDELPLLKQLMTPPSWRDRLQGRSVGYGVESAVPVIAPYVLVVVVWARSVVGDETKKVMEKRLRALTRRVLGDKEPEQITPPAFPHEANPDDLREAVSSYAVTMGLNRKKASLLADAVVGHMMSRGKQ